MKSTPFCEHECDHDVEQAQNAYAHVNAIKLHEVATLDFRKPQFLALQPVCPDKCMAWAQMYQIYITTCVS